MRKGRLNIMREEKRREVIVPMGPNIRRLEPSDRISPVATYRYVVGSQNFEPCYFIVHILYLIVIVLKFVSITIC